MKPTLAVCGPNTPHDSNQQRKNGRPGVSIVGNLDTPNKHAGNYMESLLIGNQGVEINLRLKVTMS